MKHTKSSVLILIMLGLLLVIAVFSLTRGSMPIALDNIFGIIIKHLGGTANSGNFTAEQEAVLWYVRLPRLLVGLLVGAALATAGAVMQGLFGNPLADPGIIGISAGAATGAVFSIGLGLAAHSVFLMPLTAFAGAALAITCTVFLSMRQGKIPVITLLLSGVAVSMLLGAITSGMLTFLSQQKLQEYLFWMVGGLDYRRWEHVGLAFYPITLGIIALSLLSRQLNILALGETEAKAVGMNVMPMRLLLLAIASLITAAAVCVSGNIGFVGLVIPHIMRLLVGPDHRRLIPTAALGGAIFLIICDTLGRSIFAPAELRVGIMTALLGTPYFLHLLRKLNR